MLEEKHRQLVSNEAQETETMNKPAQRVQAHLEPRLKTGDGGELQPSTTLHRDMVIEAREQHQLAVQAHLDTSLGRTGAAIPLKGSWRSIGPTSVKVSDTGFTETSGRITGIATVPGDAPNQHRVYVATSYGGVWRSLKGGEKDGKNSSWEPLMDPLGTRHAFDEDPVLNNDATSLACGAIAVAGGDTASQDRIYVGMGDANSGAYYGIGPVISIDGGQRWHIEATAKGDQRLVGGAFFELAIDPKDPNCVVAATDRGLYRRETDKTLDIIDASNDEGLPVTITTSGKHGLSDGDLVFISGVEGNTAANGDFEIEVPNDFDTKFILKNTYGNGEHTKNTGTVESFLWRQYRHRAYPIEGGTTGSSGTAAFNVSGDQWLFFDPDQIISVTNSTGNNGKYTVSDVNYNDEADLTIIKVKETITSSTFDGQLTFGFDMSSVVVSKASNGPTTFYAAEYGGEIFSSNDSGKHWEKAGSGFPSIYDSQNRIALAVRPDDPSVVYALVADGSGYFFGLWRLDTPNGKEGTWHKIDPRSYEIDEVIEGEAGKAAFTVLVDKNSRFTDGQSIIVDYSTYTISEASYDEESKQTKIVIQEEIDEEIAGYIRDSHNQRPRLYLTPQDTWQEIAATGADDLFDDQGNYDIAVAVDPTDSNKVYLGGKAPYIWSAHTKIDAWGGAVYRCEVTMDADKPKIDIGNAAFIGASVHADIHALVFDKAKNLWVGCDGGLFFGPKDKLKAKAPTKRLDKDPATMDRDELETAADDNGIEYSGDDTDADLQEKLVANQAGVDSIFVSRNYGLSTMTMEYMGQHPTDSNKLYCGTQDNGCLSYLHQDGQWEKIETGDSGVAVINWCDPEQMLETYTHASVSRRTSSEDSWQSVYVPIEEAKKEKSLFYAPLVTTPYDPDPTNSDTANIVAFGSERPWISRTFARPGRADVNRGDDRITAASEGAPIQITTEGSLDIDTDLGWDLVRITGAKGNTAANGDFIAIKLKENTCNLYSTIRKEGNYRDGSGTIQKLDDAGTPIGSSISVFDVYEELGQSIGIMTEENHGLNNGDQVRISDIQGTSTANGDFYIAKQDDDHFLLLNKTQGNKAYSGGGALLFLDKDTLDTGDWYSIPHGTFEDDKLEDTITSLVFADPNKLYAGIDGKVYRYTYTAGSWKRDPLPEPPLTNSVMSIAIDPKDQNGDAVYIAFGGSRVEQGHVWHYDPANNVWTERSQGLLDVSHNAIAVDPDPIDGHVFDVIDIAGSPITITTAEPHRLTDNDRVTVINCGAINAEGGKDPSSANVTYHQIEIVSETKFSLSETQDGVFFYGGQVFTLLVDQAIANGKTITTTRAHGLKVGDQITFHEARGSSIDATVETTDGDATFTVSEPVTVAQGDGITTKMYPLYVGADVGIWRSLDEGRHWEPFSRGLPDSAVIDLKFHPSIGPNGSSNSRHLPKDGLVRLRASTYGRGVYEFCPDPKISTILGDPVSTDTLYRNTPVILGLALDNEGNNLFLSQYYSRMWAMGGTILMLGVTEESKIGKGKTIELLNEGDSGGYSGYWNDLAVDQAGNLYICDYRHSCIRKVSLNDDYTVSSNDIIAGVYKDPGADSPSSIALFENDDHKFLYVVYSDDHTIHRLDLTEDKATYPSLIVAGTPGQAGHTGDGGPALKAKLHYPQAVTLDASGRWLYISDSFNSVIRKVALDADFKPGNITHVAGQQRLAEGRDSSGNYFSQPAEHSGDGGEAKKAYFTMPDSLQVDDEIGALYILDGGNNCIRRVTDLSWPNFNTGIITTVVGQFCQNTGPQHADKRERDSIAPQSATKANLFYGGYGGRLPMVWDKQRRILYFVDSANVIRKVEGL